MQWGWTFWQLQGVNSLRPCKIASWKASWERLASLKVAEQPCEIQSIQCQWRGETVSSSGLGQLLKEVKPDLVYMSYAPPSLQLWLAGLPCVEAIQRVLIEWSLPVDPTIVCIVLHHHRLQNGVHFTGFVMHMTWVITRHSCQLGNHFFCTQTAHRHMLSKILLATAEIKEQFSDISITSICLRACLVSFVVLKTEYRLALCRKVQNSEFTLHVLPHHGYR